MSNVALNLIRAAAIAKFGPLAGFAVLAGSAYKLLEASESGGGASLKAAANVFNELVGGKAGELFGSCFGNFDADRNGDLERSMHAAAKEAIGAIQEGAPGGTSGWFDSWLDHLRTHTPEETFTGSGETNPQLLHHNGDFRAGWWAAMEPTLIVWAGRSALGIGGTQLPKALAEYVKETLPDAMERAHDHVLRSGEYSRSWIAVQQSNWEALFRLLRDDKRILPTREEELLHLGALRDACALSAMQYSPLRATARLLPKAPESRLTSLWRDNPAISMLTHQKRRGVESTEAREYADILEAYGTVRRAAVLGAPGAGKSTALRRLADSLAQKAIDDVSAPIPFFVPLREWSILEPLDVFVGRKGIGWSATELGNRNRAVYLLDGLNEIPSDQMHAVVAFLRSVPAPITIYVSCRREDYTGNLDLHLDTLSIEPLTPRQIRAAVHQWVAAGGQPADLAERFFWELAGHQRLKAVFEKWEEKDEFWTATEVIQATTWEEDALWRRHVQNERSLVKLAANPFMLTMLYNVWLSDPDQPALPANRGKLLGLFIDCLQDREREIYRGAGEIPREELSALAWEMQTRTRGTQVSLPRAEAVRILGSDSTLKRSLDSTVLDGGDVIYFRHQLLQEYFAAQALGARLDSYGPTNLWPADRWWERNGWEESLVLLAGCNGEPVIRWVADAQPEVAAQCISESGAEIEGKEQLLRELQKQWMPRMLSEPAPEARAAVGRALGRLKLDHRPGVGVKGELPDIVWVEISPEFEMAKYLITNSQFQAFVDAADGYRNDRWWEGFTNPERNAAAPSWSESNHPRETVSWHESMAFCRWLSFKTGQTITLPTEAQWEQAAAGGEGREYPWGNGYQRGAANIDETYDDKGPHILSRTSPVGIYPAGASKDGVLDLCGNVWEWCLNEHSDWRNTEAGGEGSRALRGGSWINIHNGARVAYRNDGHPRVRNYNVGFRVVSLSPIR